MTARVFAWVRGDRHHHYASALKGPGPGDRTGPCDHCGKMVRE